MTTENFAIAVDSLADWSRLPSPLYSPGWKRTVAMIGGNPCAAKNFEEHCKVFQKSGVAKECRGLWTNNFLGFGTLIKETFGAWSNLNVHGNEEAAAEMREVFPNLPVYGAAPHNIRSVHAAQWTAIQDFVGKHPDVPDEAAMWKLIEGCDINKDWSGSIFPFDIADGTQTIRGYFCEIAGVFEVLKAQRDRRDGKPYGPTHGVEIKPGWWRKGMDDAGFLSQHKEWCRQCGHPLKLRGHEDLQFTDDFSETHRDLVQIAIKRKHGAVMHEPKALSEEQRAIRTTDYQRLVTA